jgi:DNA-binding transcriptional MocR family regulator
MLQYKSYLVMSRYQIQGSNTAEIASSVEQSVQAGALKPGSRLPTIRDLAGKLRVSPVTVAAAYRLLQARGLIVGGGRRGTHVRHQTHAHVAAPIAPTEFPGAIDLATGNPDPELLPNMGPHLSGLAHVHHSYGDPLEFRPLVAFAAAEFDADGIPSTDIVITSGALDAVERVLREHLRAGDRVVVEDPTLPALLDLLASMGLTPHPCAIDEAGPEAVVLERALGATARAVIVSPRAQNPTGAVLSASRASELGRVLRQRPEALLVEIDSCGPISGAPLRTLIDPARRHWVAIRSTSKFLGPDLRVAAMAADAITAGRVKRRQASGIRWISHLLQALTLSLWSDPSSGRRLARAADVYRHRRTALMEALASHEIGAHGQSGYNVWIPVREEAAVVSGLAARGWAVAAGERFRMRSAPGVRVTTAGLLPDDAVRFADDLSGVLRSAGAVTA